MRIVIPIHSFEPGGVERVALRLAAKWQAAGEDVTVVLGREEGGGRIDEANGLRYRTYRSIVRTARFETLWMSLCLCRYLRREQADIVFCPGNTYSFVCAAARLLLGRRCPPVVAKISNDLRRADLPAPYRWAYHVWVRVHGGFITRFVALAEPMAPEVVEQIAIAPERVSVIPDPALTAAEFARLTAGRRRQCPRDGAVIVAVGRLVRQKNIALLLRAFAAHAPAEDFLHVAGDGPELARLQRLASDLGIAGRVTFSGHCPDVPGLLEHADIFALSSDYEGVPAVIIEALAAGLPIVATDCSASMAWLTGHGQDGIIVPAGDRERLGLALREIRDLPVPSGAGRLRATRFTVEKAAATYLALFDAVLEVPTRSKRNAQSDAKERAQFS